MHGLPKSPHNLNPGLGEGFAGEATMNILMLSNTYSPHVGGVAKSVSAFSHEFRNRGHRVIVIAPQFEGMPEHEEDVIRVPAIQNFNGSDFSVRLPIPGLVSAALENFQADIIHSHHPFLLGDTALFLAKSQNIPLVFTHHTMYEKYTHYVPGDSPMLQRFVIELSTGYANLCDLVFSPSESIASVLLDRGVKTPMQVIPTGVQLDRFRGGDGNRFRKEAGIPENAFVIGHLGRLAPEKNLDFLAKAVALYIRENPQAHFLVVGVGPSKQDVRDYFEKCGLSDRLHMQGIVTGETLASAYRAMDVFAFASQSETQGMVLTEALACGTPIVAVDAQGVREVVEDGVNGRLLAEENLEDFVSALSWTASLPPEKVRDLQEALKRTADRFSMQQCAGRALSHYESLRSEMPNRGKTEDAMWSQALRMIESEWELWVNRAHAAGSALHKTSHTPPGHHA